MTQLEPLPPRQLPLMPEIPLEESFIDPAIMAELEETAALDKEPSSNLTYEILRYLESYIHELEQNCIENIGSSLQLIEFLNQLKDEIKSSGNTNGILKIVFGVLTALPMIVTGLNTRKWGNYEPDKLLKVGEGISVMMRQFGDATSTFVQTKQEVKKTDQQFQTNALQNKEADRRKVYDNQSDAGRQINQTIDILHQAFELKV